VDNPTPKNKELAARKVNPLKQKENWVSCLEKKKKEKSPSGWGRGDGTLVMGGKKKKNPGPHKGGVGKVALSGLREKKLNVGGSKLEDRRKVGWGKKL